MSKEAHGQENLDDLQDENSPYGELARAFRANAEYEEAEMNDQMALDERLKAALNAFVVYLIETPNLDFWAEADFISQLLKHETSKFETEAHIGLREDFILKSLLESAVDYQKNRKEEGKGGDLLDQRVKDAAGRLGE